VACCASAALHGQPQFDESMFFDKEKKKIIVGVKEEPPFIMKDAQGNYYGLSIDLWEDLAKKDDIDYEYQDFRDYLLILRALTRKDIDVSISPLTVSYQRLHSFEVSQPFFISSLGVAVYSHGSVISKLLSRDILVVIGSLILLIALVGTVMWLVERRRNTIEFSESPRLGMLDGIWWAAVTMTTVGYGDKTPKTRSGRALALLWMFTSIMLISSLTASITSHLAHTGDDMNITHVEDLAEMQDKVGTVAHSGSADYLRNNGIELPNRCFYENPLDGLKALKKGDIRVFVYDKPIMYYLLTEHNLEDDVTILPVTFNKNYCSFMFPQGSKLLRSLDPDLIEHINLAAWRLTLRKYNIVE
jgi:ABC-type amino acid transport substrate-binding protein